MNITLPKGKYYSNNIFDTYIDESNNNIIINNINKLNTYNGIAWKNYRLGDTIGAKNHNLGHTIDKQLETIAKKWPNSLIHKYFLLKKSKNIGWNNKVELNKLLDEHEKINFNNHDNNYIAMHLRVGDGFSWRTPLEIYDIIFTEKFKDIKDIKDIIIFCGSHNCGGPATKQTINYLNDVSNILNKRGYNVIVRSSNSADDDLCLMVKAKYFIPGGICNKIKKGGGGYCGLVRFLRSGYNIITI